MLELKVQKDTTLPRDQLLLDRVKLSVVPGLGPTLRHRLISEFGSVSKIFEQSISSLQRVHGVGNHLASAIFSSRTSSKPSRILDECKQHGINILLNTDPEFPELLSHIPDPPDMLFIRGTLEPYDRVAIAVVGARHATTAGKRIAKTFANGLARAGLTIVSGLARGIDTAAHHEAIRAGGRTIAVLGSGLRNIYPREHAHFVEDIIQHGCVLSEVPPSTPPQAAAFPRRNRIVSGLCVGTLVIQASERSGALITARLAGEQGRDVFAIPGSIECRMSAGCHSLIRDGVTLVTSVDQILDELGPLYKKAICTSRPEIHHLAERKLNKVEQNVLAAIDATSNQNKSTTIDAVVEYSNLEPSRVLAACSALEIYRITVRSPGNIIERR